LPLAETPEPAAASADMFDIDTLTRT
jgi:hypothetical protein